MKKLLFLLIPVLIAGCQKQKNIIINGTLPGSEGKYLVLENIEISTPVTLDSVLIGKSGKFSFKVPVTEPDFYQLSLSDNNFVTLLVEPGEKVRVNFTSNNLFWNYEVFGSEGTAVIRQLDIHLRKTIQKLDSLTAIFEENKNQPGFDTLGIRLNESYALIMSEQRKYSIGFILNHLNSLAAIKALYQKYDPQTYVLYDIKDLQYMKIVADTLQVYYPDSKHTRALLADLEKEMVRYNLMKVTDMAASASPATLDIGLPNLKGDTIYLSSLKGNYVLLSFWASWDQASVEENIIFKSLYNKYNSKGFEIYQVSFDSEEEAWEKAIKFDELPWINVSDLKYPNSHVIRVFNVKKIPMNYLIDTDGSIMAGDLHGRGLKIKLEQIFGF